MLKLERLEDRDTPSSVRPDWDGPFKMLQVDVNHDQVRDYVFAAGEGMGPRVQIKDGKDGRDVASFFAFGDDFRGGIGGAIITSDPNGRLDVSPEITLTPGVGGGPVASVFKLDRTELVQTFFVEPYSHDYRGGLLLNHGFVNGRDLIIAMPSSFDDPIHVASFDPKSGEVVSSFFVGGPGYRQFEPSGGVVAYNGSLNAVLVQLGPTVDLTAPTVVVDLITGQVL